jgi:hypothetical protein
MHLRTTLFATFWFVLYILQHSTVERWNFLQYIHVIVIFPIHVLGNKYWSGLLRDYYGPRAAIYFKFLIESLEEGHDFQLKDWRREWIKLTNDWQRSRNPFPVASTGNALQTSRWLYNKYLRSSDT